jgi:hypothetical protein
VLHTAVRHFHETTWKLSGSSGTGSRELTAYCQKLAHEKAEKTTVAMWRSRRHELGGCHDLREGMVWMYQASGMHAGIPTMQRQGSGDALGGGTGSLTRPIFRRQRGKRKAESGREHGTILLLTGGVKHGSEPRIQYPGDVCPSRAERGRTVVKRGRGGLICPNRMGIDAYTHTWSCGGCWAGKSSNFFGQVG